MFNAMIDLVKRRTKGLLIHSYKYDGVTLQRMLASAYVQGLVDSVEVDND